MADDERTFSPTEAEANRAAQQGLGVGEREMALQRDPGEDAPADLALEASDEGDDDDTALDARRGGKIGQGSKTRQHTKDIISRRA